MDENVNEIIFEPFFSTKAAEEFEKLFVEQFSLLASNRFFRVATPYSKYFVQCPHCESEQEVGITLKAICFNCKFVYEIAALKP